MVQEIWYSNSETIQFHLFAINDVSCTVMRGTNCAFLLVYMNWTDGQNLQFMVSPLKAVSQVKRTGPGLDTP